jgi:hypothetical protein
MSVHNKISSFFGMLAGALMSMFAKGPASPGVRDLQAADFKTSTQRLGVRFTDKIRNIFRFRWIKRA